MQMNKLNRRWNAHQPRREPFSVENTFTPDWKLHCTVQFGWRVGDWYDALTLTGIVFPNFLAIWIVKHWGHRSCQGLLLPMFSFLPLTCVHRALCGSGRDDDEVTQWAHLCTWGLWVVVWDRLMSCILHTQIQRLAQEVSEAGKMCRERGKSQVRVLGMKSSLSTWRVLAIWPNRRFNRV